MTYIKSNFKTILLSIFCIIGLTTFLLYPHIENIPIVYPNHNLYIGETLSKVKNDLGNKLYETDNDGGNRSYRYFVFNDIVANSKIRIHSLLTFSNNKLVSFYSQFKTIDSSYNSKEWLIRQYSQTINNVDCKSYNIGDKLNFKLQKDRLFIHLAIDNKYSNFSSSTYLVGDYRYKEIDWDKD